MNTLDLGDNLREPGDVDPPMKGLKGKKKAAKKRGRPKKSQAPVELPPVEDFQNPEMPVPDFFNYVSDDGFTEAEEVLGNEEGYRTGPMPGSPGGQGEDGPSFDDLVDEYEEMFRRNPQLRFHPEVVHRTWDDRSGGTRAIERELARLQEIIDRPFLDKFYGFVWKCGVGLLEFGLTNLPGAHGLAFSPVPSPYNPEPKTLNDALTKPEVVEKAIPVLEEALADIPLINELARFADPRAQLALVVADAVKEVYTHNINTINQNASVGIRSN